MLWDTDPERARELFRRAWEAAEIVDAETAKKHAEEMRRLENAGEPVVVRGGPDLRTEVLRLVARRDRKLGEEFLKALDEAAEKARSEAAADQRRNSGFQPGASHRLQLARRLIEDGEVERALEFARPVLEQAAAEARRIGGSDPDRAKALTAVAVGFGELDRVRSWELLAEVVKAANGAEGFTGEDSRISSRLQTKMMVVMNQASAPDFDLLALFRHLARADLLRAVQLAKTFTGEAPRAVATLAIARSVLEKRKDPTPGGTN